MSQWLELHVTAEQITVRLAADAPPEAWDALIGAPVDAEAPVLDALARGFQLSIDGHTHPLTRVSGQRRWDLTTGSATTWEVTLVADVDLRGGRHRVNVGNRNLQEGPSWLRDDVMLAPDAVLYDTSLFREDALERRVDRTATWLVAETLRGVSLDVAFPDDPLTALFARAIGRPRTPAEAEVRPTLTAWRSGADTRESFLAAAVLSVLLGLTAATVVRSARVWGVAAALALASPVLPTIPIAWLAGAALTGALAGVDDARRTAWVVWLAPVAVGLWAARAVDTVFAGTWLFVVLGAVASPLLVRLDRPRLVAGALAALSVVAATRGIG